MRPGLINSEYFLIICERCYSPSVIKPDGGGEGVFVKNTMSSMKEIVPKEVIAISI